MKHLHHEADLCVVGGGIAGVCTALSAARHGARVILMQDRPVLGGNASSEIRMWVCGANGEYDRETGIVEEMFLENYYYNPNLSFSIWDSVLYGLCLEEPNLELMLNCTCQKAEMDGNKIKNITGWQLTTETYHTVSAKYYADCSGDSILAPLSGAEFMLGREAKREYGETIPPDEADSKTMGQSCLIQVREYETPQKYTPPKWAYKYPDEASMPVERDHSLYKLQNFWWVEVGGTGDILHDTEKNRDELLKIAFGVWDHMKNCGDHGVENWAIDWVGFLPGKRESRRYKGMHVLTENDILARGEFSDTIAYGGWTMDDHAPEGIYFNGSPNTFHPAPSPYGIPLSCLISKNIENLTFAGRNISTTHAAMSSTRVMATCGVLGQALGTAVAMAVEGDTPIREIDVAKLQQTLAWDDCFLPGIHRELSELTKAAKTNAPVLQNGKDRNRSKTDCESYIGAKGDAVYYEFSKPEKISEIRVIFDSCLERHYDNMPSQYPLYEPDYKIPESLVRAFTIVAHTADGDVVLASETENHQRLYRIKTDVVADKISIIPTETWGAEKVSIFSFDVR